MLTRFREIWIRHSCRRESHYVNRRLRSREDRGDPVRRQDRHGRSSGDGNVTVLGGDVALVVIMPTVLWIRARHGRQVCARESDYQRAMCLIIPPDGKSRHRQRSGNLAVFRLTPTEARIRRSARAARSFMTLPKPIGRDAVLQPDGKIVIAGEVLITSGNQRFTVFR